MDELSARFVALSTATAVDQQTALDRAHSCRILNDEYARLAVAGTVALSGGGQSAISSGSTLVQILPTGHQPSTRNALAGAP